MIYKHIISFTSIFILNFVICACQDGHFKVPLEIREKSRPTRLIDNTNDPDLRKLKEIQDEFFNSIANSSLGKDYKNFTQVINFFDSESGKNFRWLLLNGVLIGYKKENSYQLLTEFFDDFKYRLNPDLADALNNYRDFMKTFDISMIPPTIDFIFRKNQFGKSLADMPLGQLIDMIQPELDRYGIDARSFMNAIVGKGDSTVPNMVQKLTKNFNASQVMNIAKNLATNFMGPKTSVASKEKGPKKDQTLMLFKPLIANLLKENNIDLDTEAVIQVLTPLVANGGQYIETIMQSFQGNGEKVDFAQWLPMMAVLASQMGGNTDKGKPNIFNAAASLLQNNNDLGALAGLASQFMNPNKNQKIKANSEKNENKKGSGFDPDMLSLMSQALGGGGDLGNVIGQLAGQAMNSNFDAGKVMQMASSFMSGFKPKKQSAPKAKTANKNEISNEHKPQLTELLDDIMYIVQKDEAVRHKVHTYTDVLKVLLLKEVGDFDKLFEKITFGTTAYMKQKNMDANKILKPLSFSQKEWHSALTSSTGDPDVENMISVIADMITEAFIDAAKDGNFVEQQNKLMTEQFQDALSFVGLTGLTLDNFPDRLKPIIAIQTQEWSNSGIDFVAMLRPTQEAIKYAFKLYMMAVEKIPSLNKKELRGHVLVYLEKDLIKPLRRFFFSHFEASKKPRCVANALCRRRASERDAEFRPIRNVVEPMAGLLYGAFVSGQKQKVDSLTSIEVFRATIFQGKCQYAFPIDCTSDDDHQEL